MTDPPGLRFSAFTAIVHPVDSLNLLSFIRGVLCFREYCGEKKEEDGRRDEGWKEERENVREGEMKDVNGKRSEEVLMKERREDA